MSLQFGGVKKMKRKEDESSDKAEVAFLIDLRI